MSEMVAGRGKKKERNFGPRTLPGLTLPGPTLRGSGEKVSGGKFPESLNQKF